MRSADKIIIAAAVACTAFTPCSATTTLGGFVKNFFVADRLSAPDGETLLANNLRARIVFVSRPRSWAVVNVEYNLVPRWQNDTFSGFNTLLVDASVSEYRAIDFDATLIPSAPDTTHNLLLLHNLDRASVTLRAPHFDFIMGRQAVAWGSARGINPTDVIAPFLFTEIDTENRVGVDGARLRTPIGRLGEVDAGYIVGNDFEWKRSAVFARIKGSIGSVDPSFLLMVFRRNTMVGMDLAGSLGGAGWWLEASHVDIADGKAGEDYTRASVGADYSLGNGVYLFGEYHFNGPGESDPSRYPDVASTAAFVDGAVYLFGRHYLIPGMSWPATPLLTLVASGLMNMNDRSFLVAPNVDFSISENTFLSAGAFAGFGGQADSEFRAYPDTYFASIRYYF